MIITPSIKPSERISGSFLLRVTRAPICSPMGCMATSAPTEKNIMPTTTITAPIRKLSSTPLGMRATVRLRMSTTVTMGRTAASASRSFSSSFFLRIMPYASLLNLT